MDYDVESLRNTTFFNFNDAIENYGFDFNTFMSDGFAKFIKETFIDNFINFRKAYIMRDYPQLKFYAHKFKGSFL
jgi:hypothetical protein